MPQTRPVSYSQFEHHDEQLADSFVMIEARPGGGVAHAIAIPKGWLAVEELPIAADPDGPQIGSLMVEDPSMGDGSAIIVCGHTPGAFGADAREVVRGLAVREGLDVDRYKDDAECEGGVRAMASSDDRTAAFRILPHEGDWIFFWAMGPTVRLTSLGEAFREGLSSFRALSPWRDLQ